MKLGDSVLLFELRANPDVESAVGIFNERINTSKDNEEFVQTANLFSYKEGIEYIFQWADKNYNFVVRGEKSTSEQLLKALGILKI
jgi:hypothetical protein